MRLKSLKKIKIGVKLLVISLLFNLFSCNPSSLDGKLYCKYDKVGTTYWYFIDSSTYRELFYGPDKIQILDGRYIYQSGKLSFSKLLIFDQELIAIYDSNVISSTVMVNRNSIRLATDLQESDFINRDLNSVSADIKVKLGVK